MNVSDRLACVMLNALLLIMQQYVRPSHSLVIPCLLAAAMHMTMLHCHLLWDPDFRQLSGISHALQIYNMSDVSRGWQYCAMQSMHISAVILGPYQCMQKMHLLS